MSIQISFIIPHKGRENMLIATLESIKRQTLPNDEYEVIVVSQNTEASEQLAAFSKALSLTIIYNSDDNTISHSRNLGAKNASGDYLAFLDADVDLAANWAEVMVRTIKQNNDIALVFGTQVNSESAPPIEKIRTALASGSSGGFTDAAPGANLFLNRNTFIKSNGFPETLRTCEDIYFTNKVSLIGKLYHCPEAKFVHLGEDKAFAPMFKKEIWRGQSNIASLQGRRIPLRELPSFFVPFAVVIGMLTLLLCLMYSQTNFAIIAAMVAGLPLLAYTLRLKKLVGKHVSLFHCLLFYTVYFPARSIGTVLGVRGAVGTSSHK